MNFRTSLFLAYPLACLLACGGGEKKTEKESAKETKTETEKPSEKEDTAESKPSALDEQALQSIKGYFDGLNEGDYEKASNNFTKKVVQWITLKNITPQAVAKEAKRFLSTKKGVKYTLKDESFSLHGTTAFFQVQQQWAGYDATVTIEASFDKTGKIFSYIERKASFKTRNTNVSNLEAYLKKLPQRKLPIQFNTGESDKELSDLGLKVLYSPEDQKMIKDMRAVIRTYECFWYPIAEDVVGIVTANGGRIILFTLTTFNRKTGERFDE
jgi:hypothetical protein